MSETKHDILFSTDARKGLKDGVDKLANAVKVTFGAAGRNVVYTDVFGRRKVTKDGVTVAKQVVLTDPIESMGADMVKEVAIKTGDTVGDGTTTATILAQAITAEGYKNITAGANPIELKRGIDMAVAAVVKHLERVTIPVKDRETIKHIATISANNDAAIGELIGEAFEATGSHGVIRVEKSKDWNTYIEIINGMKLDRGLASAYFVSDPEKEETVFENPLILLYDGKIDTFKELVNILTEIINAKLNRPLVIIADDFEGSVLETLAVNNARGELRIAAIKAPEYGDARKEILNDIAAFTSSQVGSESIGFPIEAMNSTFLGTAEKMVMGKKSTIIIGGFTNPHHMQARVELLTKKITETDVPEVREPLLKRLANINGGVALLHVGASSEIELNEKIDRADDAVGATRAAIEEGIVMGGGVTLLRAKSALDRLKPSTPDELTGIRIVRRALEAPIKAIVENAGYEGSVVVNNLLTSFVSPKTGFDVNTGKYINMLKYGIIDPKKVTRVALESAASVSGMILLTECVLVNSNG